MVNFVYNFPHKLPNQLRLVGILQNYEILGKSQNWLEGEPSAQSPFYK